MEQPPWEGATVPMSRELYMSGLEELKLGVLFSGVGGPLCLGRMAVDCKVRKAEMQNLGFALSFPFSLEC